MWVLRRKFKTCDVQLINILDKKNTKKWLFLNKNFEFWPWELRGCYSVRSIQIKWWIREMERIIYLNWISAWIRPLRIFKTLIGSKWKQIRFSSLLKKNLEMLWSTLDLELIRFWSGVFSCEITPVPVAPISLKMFDSSPLLPII